MTDHEKLAAEAPRHATDVPSDVAEIAPEHPEPGSLDSAALQDALLGAWAEDRRTARALVRDPRLHRDPLLGMDEHRERVLGQLGVLVENGAVHRMFPKEFGGDDNHGGNIAAFADLVLGDPSLQIKAGVQWGLFAAAILHLGTEEHHRRWLPGAMDLSVPGAFAMTEIGHGSDVASIGTTATYDEAAGEFVIHTPFKGAWKDYLATPRCTAGPPPCSPSSSRRASTTACTASTCRSVTRTGPSCRGSAARTTASRAA